MAGGIKERSLEETPTWAVTVVCFVLVVISFGIEYLIHLTEKWLKSKHKRGLLEALEKIKAELMLLGFISLLLTVGQDPITKICIPTSVGNSWHPCDNDGDSGDTQYADLCAAQGKVQLVSTYGIHQLHIFIFVLAVFHVLYCIATVALGRLKMRKWKVWEDETKTIEYQYYNDPERFRFARETSFGRRHLSSWSKSPFLLWIVCFFRQFHTSVAKVDYLTLRNGFITAHLAPQNQTTFDFQKYISRSLEEDFKVVVGISPIIWLFAVLFLLSNTHGWYSYLWLPFIPLIIILLMGTKLQVIITKMGVRAQDRDDVVRGTTVVQPGDELFWFNRPRFIIFLINFVLFQNAFQLAFFMWSWYEFGLRSCFHQRISDISIRISMGVIVQFVCSYVTLPLYALVTQMGTTMKPTIFSEQVATALRSWHHTAKKHMKHSQHSESNSAFSSKPATPTHVMSPSVHLLHHHDKHQKNNSNKNNNNNKNDVDSLKTLPRKSSIELEGWGTGCLPNHHENNNDNVDSLRTLPRKSSIELEGWGTGCLPNHHEAGNHPPNNDHQPEREIRELHPAPIDAHHEIQISLNDFSFVNKK